MAANNIRYAQGIVLETLSASAVQTNLASPFLDFHSRILCVVVNHELHHLNCIGCGVGFEASILLFVD